MPTGLGSRPTFSYSHPRSSRYISFARQKPWFSAALRAASCPSSNALRLRSLAAAQKQQRETRKANHHAEGREQLRSNSAVQHDHRQPGNEEQKAPRGLLRIYNLIRAQFLENEIGDDKGDEHSVNVLPDTHRPALPKPINRRSKDEDRKQDPDRVGSPPTGESLSLAPGEAGFVGQPRCGGMVHLGSKPFRIDLQPGVLLTISPPLRNAVHLPRPSGAGSCRRYDSQRYISGGKLGLAANSSPGAACLAHSFFLKSNFTMPLGGIAS